jgi:hypothetical protein
MAVRDRFNSRLSVAAIEESLSTSNIGSLDLFLLRKFQNDSFFFS